MTITYTTRTNTRIVFSLQVLEHFKKFQQKSVFAHEAGGQLFARIDGHAVHIEQATGPKRADRRTRFLFMPNRICEQRETYEMHKMGLHFVGDWHTHPEAIPTPSKQDISSAEEMFKKSEHDLMGFLLVIVGNKDVSSGLFVAVVDDHSVDICNYLETDDV